MNKRNLLYIAIIIICVISIIIGVYYQIFKPNKKQNTINNNTIDQDNVEDKIEDAETLKAEFNSLFNNSFDDQGYDITGITKIAGLESKDIIYAAYNVKDEKDGKYSVDINLPVFNVQGEVGEEFNRTTQTVFANKGSQILTNSTEYTIYNVEYVAYLNDNILSLVIKSTLKEGENPQRIIVQTYNYDIKTGQKVLLNDILNARQIDTTKVNSKIEKVIKEANKNAEAISTALSQNIYKRDLNNAMYVTDNVNHFFVGLDGQIYIVYPYGNSNFTSEIDIIKV